jgi:hypothetical protein
MAKRYNEIRDRYVLVRHDPEEAALHVLLRFDAAEDAALREKLRELDFYPSASPAHASVGWLKHVATPDVAATCARLSKALGDVAVLDLGGTFTDDADDWIQRIDGASYWDGKFLLHVGGTRRCVVFDANVDAQDLARTVAAARDDYDAHDFHPATE